MNSTSSKNVGVDGASNNPLPSPPSSNLQAPSLLSTPRLQAKQDVALTNSKASKNPSRDPSSLSTRQDSDRASANEIKKPAKKNANKTSGNEIKKLPSAPLPSSTKSSLPPSDKLKAKKENLTSRQISEKSKANVNWIMDLFEIAKNHKIEPATTVEPAVEPVPHQEEIKTPVAPVQKSPHCCRHRRRQRQRRETKLKPSSNANATNEEKSQEDLPKEKMNRREDKRKKRV